MHPTHMTHTGSLLPFVGGGGKGGGGGGGFLKGRKRATPGTAAAGAAKASTATKKAKKALTQTYLDLGQNSHGKRTLCGSCGMLYVNGEAEDERDHAAFCKSVDAALGFPGWKAERCVRVGVFVVVGCGMHARFSSMYRRRTGWCGARRGRTAWWRCGRGTGRRRCTRWRR